MTSKKRVVAQIKHKETDFIPYTLFFEDDSDETIKHGSLERVNSYFGNDSWRTKFDNHIVFIPAINDKVARGPGKTFCTDVYGAQWRVDTRPMHLEKSALNKASLSGYRFPNPDAFFHEGWYEHALELVDKNKEHFLVTAKAFGLFEQTWVLRGFENVLMDSILHPHFYQELIHKIFEEYMILLDKVLTLPIDGFMFGDDWGHQQGIMIGAVRWRKYFKPYLAELYAKVHRAGKYTIHHMCGSIAEILPDLIDIGLDVYESVQPEAKNNSPYRLKKLYGKNLTFWGGLGSQSMIPFGTESGIKSEVRKLCKEMGKGGGYILSSAKPIQPETPTENAVAVIEAFAEEAGISI